MNEGPCITNSVSEIKEKNPSFGTSLILSHIGPNSHMTPKIVNGSFAALFDNNDVVHDFNKRIEVLRTESKDSGKIFKSTFRQKISRTF